MIDAYARRLANAREAVARAAANIASIEIEIDNSPIGKQLATLNEEAGELAAELQEAEQEMREAALHEYGVTGVKELTGCKIAIYATLDYSESEATSWCVEHNHSNLLKLNKSAFEKVAKELAPAFVKIAEEARVRIDSDLSTYLQGENDGH